MFHIQSLPFVPSLTYTYRHSPLYRTHLRGSSRCIFLPVDYFDALSRGIHHLRLLFLEPLSDPLTPRHEFLHAPRDAARFALHEGFGGEVVDAGFEAVVYEAGEHL